MGKTCSRRLILNQRPQEQSSTGLMEDPVRSICTSKMMSTDGIELEEIDEDKMIQMIQREVLEAAAKEQQANVEDISLDHPEPSIINPTHLSSDNETAGYFTRSEVLHQIAAGIDSLGTVGVPALFKCHHINLVDSGGQPHFSNLLPLVFRSETHNHLVVTRLDKKLSDKPTNCFKIKDVSYVLPETLQLSNYQLIERVCQLASGSKSHVCIIGTHKDKQSKEEPLAKKNELLAPLKKKYENNLVLTEENEPIFAVNAMAPEGEERTKYTQTLQKVILNAPLLAGTEGNAVGKRGIKVNLRWTVLELELSHRSKGVDVLEMSEIEGVAKDLRIDNLPKALDLFNELAILHHYPEALPNIVFTSITPISKQLSAIVEASFPCHNVNPSDIDLKRLQKTGVLTLCLLERLHHKLPADKLFPLEDFLSLMKHLRVLIDIDTDTFLIPSLLPVETLPSENNYHEPLVCFWLNDSYGEAKILPQAYFHALIVELLRTRGQVRLSEQRKHSRSTFNFLITLGTGDESKECKVKLVDQVSWLEIFVDSYSKHEHCRQLLLEIIQPCSKRVLEQLKQTDLGDLQYGLHCYSDQCKFHSSPHPSKCVYRAEFVFACLLSEYQWKEESDEKLFWFKGYG